MDYEKEYKHLKGKIEKAYLFSKTDSTKAVLDELLPELRESEDEMIRKEIISALKFANDDGVYDKHLVWLEKQGEHKPADKIEPKFKVGDWITHNTANFIFKIINVGSNGYEVVNRENYKKTISFDNEDNYHHWTIQDAKDGDVLYSPCCKLLWIYKDGNSCYIGNNLNYNKNCVVVNSPICIPTDAVPATKEQHELLFQKMKEAGYEWDAEKKELKKIHVIDEGKAEMDYCFTKMMNGEKVNPAWSEEDELMLLSIIQSLELTNGAAQIKINWLKSLKQRIGG